MADLSAVTLCRLLARTALRQRVSASDLGSDARLLRLSSEGTGAGRAVGSSVCGKTGPPRMPLGVYPSCADLDLRRRLPEDYPHLSS